MSCDHCQAQLLEFVYGLFEAGDAAEAQARADLEAHLAGCPACQAALRRVEGQKQLLAQAAKTDARTVVFRPPTEVAAGAPRPVPAVLPFPRAAARRRPVPIKLVAASVLLV